LELQALEVRIEAVEGVIVREHRTNAVSRRLASIPGIGPITASAIAATIPDPSVFKSGRELAAWIGLVPRQHSSGGKQKLGRVSKQGDRYLRRLLTIGATSVMRRLPGKTDGHSTWVAALLDRRPFRLVSLALANKMARIASGPAAMRAASHRPVCTRPSGSSASFLPCAEGAVHTCPGFVDTGTFVFEECTMSKSRRAYAPEFRRQLATEQEWSGQITRYINRTD
jgi:hypothetical protein